MSKRKPDVHWCRTLLTAIAAAPGSDEVWLAVMGPYTPALGERKGVQIYQNQYAQTMGVLLRVKFAGTHPPGEMIKEAVKEK